MNETLTDLAVEYGWGCKACGGTGEVHWDENVQHGEDDGWVEKMHAPCPRCHGNRVTPSDAEEFERLVVAVVKEGAAFDASRVPVPMRNTPVGVRFRQSLDSLQRKA